MLIISRKDADEMVTHALEEDPNECCGILGGKNDHVMKLYRVVNSDKSPYRYRMDPLGQLEADKDCDRNGWQFVAFYHSHTHSPAYPSATDVRMAVQNGWLNVWYVLVSLLDKQNPDIRVFRISPDGEIEEGKLHIKG